MKKRATGICKYVLVMCLLGYAGLCAAQTMPQTISNNPAKDTSMAKTNTSKWKEEEPRIYYEKLNSRAIYYPDSALHTFQRNKFTQPWGQDMGNLGSPVYNMMFTPEDRVGPSLGYHVFDVYAFNVDSLNYYNTARPYAVFDYHLASKLEQVASLMMTQNIRPNWNVAVEYQKINSPGFYKIERNNHDNAYITSTYKSLDKHYQLNLAMVYNKEQHDENGGIVDVTQLANPQYSDRQTLDQAYQSDQYSINRSSVSNALREFTMLLQQRYTWGKTDTVYDKDSTHYTYKLIPRFSITHKFEISTEKHQYKDLTPDSTRYTTLFDQSFPNNTGLGTYVLGGDSVDVQQKWFWATSTETLDGFLGKADNPLQFSTGIGTRYDQFVSTPIAFPHLDSLGNNYYTTGADKSSIFSNYLIGTIKKEALHPGEWEYGLNTNLYFSGADAGDFLFNALVGKELKKDLGSFVAGIKEELNSAPYSYTNYENFYTRNFYSFNKESVTNLFVTLESPALRLSGGVKNYIVSNYIYINQNEVPSQFSTAFDITELWLRKVFRLGNFYLDNELVYQQVPTIAPVNAPAFMGRHQLSHERSFFENRLKVAFGVEVKYTTEYKPAGYDALLNKFFYQNSVTILNTPQVDAFVNFRIKRFRAFAMCDNALQPFHKISNTLLFTGTPDIDFNGVPGSPGTATIYAAADILIRFGFSWVLAN